MRLALVVAAVVLAVLVLGPYLGLLLLEEWARLVVTN